MPSARVGGWYILKLEKRKSGLVWSLTVSSIAATQPRLGAAELPREWRNLLSERRGETAGEPRRLRRHAAT